jgi:hypothetical protein
MRAFILLGLFSRPQANMGDASLADAVQSLIRLRATDDARFRSLEAGQAALEAGQAALEAHVASLDSEIVAIRAGTAEQIQRERLGVWCSLDSLLESMLPHSQLSTVRAAAMDLINNRVSVPSQA